MTIAWCFLLFYFLAMPLVVLWVLFVRIPRHGLNDRRTKLLFGFLYTRFDGRQYWWEAIELTRKAIFVLVVVWGDGGFMSDEEAYIESYSITTAPLEPTSALLWHGCSSASGLLCSPAWLAFPL
ncbi:hypothetical protein OAO87_02445 [bacterium]|nr:hypothetical protein [bacterium]